MRSLLSCCNFLSPGPVAPRSLCARTLYVPVSFLDKVDRSFLFTLNALAIQETAARIYSCGLAKRFATPARDDFQFLWRRDGR